jgi:hypothetical protein
LPIAPSMPVVRLSDPGDSLSSSQGSDSTSISLTSANELSLASTNPDVQLLVTFMTEQNNRLSEQVVSLTASVKKLADGQAALSDVGAATCSALSELRGSVKVQLAENKRDTEQAMTRTLDRCNEALRILGHLSSSSGDTGVSGPPGAHTRR